MTRGNQRELARAKNAKKQEELAKKKAKDAGNAGSRLTSRQERDADIMRKKQQKALEKKGQEGGAAGGK